MLNSTNTIEFTIRSCHFISMDQLPFFGDQLPFLEVSIESVQEQWTPTVSPGSIWSSGVGSVEELWGAHVLDSPSHCENSMHS